jgi:Ribonuclease HI
LEPSEWQHPPERVLIKEPQEKTDYNIKIFTDESKTGEKVGAAAVIFQGDNLIQEIKYKLREQCSNNQAEQAAIMKALQELQGNQGLSSGRKVAALYTDSRITLSLLEIEDILKLVRFLEQNEWQIHFGWIKALARIDGDERADIGV